jgi:hypothetical protein
MTLPNERKRLATRLAVLLLALAALAVWFVVGQGARGESSGGLGLSVSVTAATDQVAPGGT